MSSVTLLYGPNHYAGQVELKKRIKSFVTQNGEHGLERWDGEALKLRDLTDLLLGVSLFSPKKLVIIHDLGKNKPLWEYIGDNLSDIPSSTQLILIEESPDRRTKTFKTLQKNATCTTLDQPSDNQLTEWIMSYMAEKGKPLDRPLANHLLRRIGSNQALIHHELEKLSLSDSPITARLINDLVEATPEGNAYELLDAALAGRIATVKNQLSLLRYSEDPYRLFGLLVSQVFTLALVHAAGSMRNESIAQETGVHPFIIRKLTPVAKSISQNELDGVVLEVVALDDRLKSSAAEPWDLLEHALTKIAARKSRI